MEPKVFHAFDTHVMIHIKMQNTGFQKQFLHRTNAGVFR